MIDYNKIWRWLLQASAVQIFLTLISLPILVAWGLPLSYLTPVGTLLFTPMLTIYLWCALAVFITTLCAIPNGYCMYALQYVTDWWLWILALIKTPWQIGFVCPPLWALICIPISAFGLVWYVRRKSLSIITAGLATLLLCWCMALKMLPTTDKITVEHANGKKLTALYTNNRVTIIDTTSCCSSMVDGASWIAYHVIPTITQQTGATHIDEFVLLHPRQRTFEALSTLIEKGMVHAVCIPYWDGNIPLRAFATFKKLQEMALAYEHPVIRMKDEIATKYQLVATAQTQKYGDATYQSYTLQTNEAKELYG